MKKHPKMDGHKVSNEHTRTFVKYVHWRRSGAFIVNFEHVILGWIISQHN